MEDSAASQPSCPIDSTDTNKGYGRPPALIVQQSSATLADSEKKDSGLPPAPSTPTNRRAIFHNFWKKSSSSQIRDDNDSVNDTSARRLSSLKVEPSYLGIYSFTPPSPLASKPGLITALSPSDDSLTPSPSPRPKSILRRHHSARLRMIHLIEGEETEGKPRSLSLCSSSEIKAPPFTAELPFASDLFEGGDTDSTSKDSSYMHTHNVHFDPTITVREVIGQKEEQDAHSSWFNEDELQTFFREAIHLCHASAINSIKVSNINLTHSV